MGRIITIEKNDQTMFFFFFLWPNTYIINITRLPQHVSALDHSSSHPPITSFSENQPLTMSSSSSSSDSPSSHSSSDSPSFERSSIDISNLDTFLSSSITSPYIQETYPPTDPSVVSAVSSVLKGSSFDISVPREVSAALSERSSAVEREVREIGSGKERDNGERVGKWMRERAKRLGEMVESWVSSGATFAPFSSDRSSGYFSGSHNDRLSTATSIPSPGTCASTSSYISSTPRSTTATAATTATTTASVELSSASRRRLATTTAANLKSSPPTIDPSTVRKIISYIRSANSNSNPPLNEEHWWTAYHALRSPSAFGTHGVPIPLSEKLARMRALRWEDVESDVGYERARAKMFLGDERLAGSHLEGWGGSTFGVA